MEPSLDQRFAERYLRSTPRADEDTIVWLLHDTARLWRKQYNRAVRAEMPGMTCARCAVLVQLAQRARTRTVPNQGSPQLPNPPAASQDPITLVRTAPTGWRRPASSRAPLTPETGEQHVLALHGPGAADC